MISNSIEGAQRKIEGRNFEARKNVLRFDDVMNSQREIIYGQRQTVLSGQDVGENVRTMMRESIAGNVALYCAGDEPVVWNLTALRDHYLGWLTKDEYFRYDEDELEKAEREAITEELTRRAEDICAAKEKKYGAELMRELERAVLLRNVDTQWMDHIDAMDELRKGIYLRGYAQRDPVVEYRIEGFDMFDAMVESIREDTTKMILTVEIRSEEQPKRTQVAKVTGASGADDGTVKKQPVRAAKKVGRNDPCPCGSGKKYKKCCGREA
jgi:preprotein translocase subunit SecA